MASLPQFISGWHIREDRLAGWVWSVQAGGLSWDWMRRAGAPAMLNISCSCVALRITNGKDKLVGSFAQWFRIWGLLREGDRPTKKKQLAVPWVVEQSRKVFFVLQHVQSISIGQKFVEIPWASRCMYVHRNWQLAPNEAEEKQQQQQLQVWAGFAWWFGWWWWW